MNEAALVARIKEIVAPTSHTKILVGIGDDAAVWQPSRSHRSIISTDALIEGVHFRRTDLQPEEIGRRALAVNLSDLAAMGARPVLATLALALSPDIDEQWVGRLYDGVVALALPSKIAVVGGDLVRAAVTMISITVVGEASPQRMLLRRGAKPGDILAVTGVLGRSRAGLALLEHASLKTKSELTAAVRADVHQAYACPVPRLPEGKMLAASAGVRAMIDISDGLALDTQRLVAASGCGAIIDHVPIGAAATVIAAALEANAEEWALSGGEDYELLVAVAPRSFAHVAKRFYHCFRRTLEPIGRCTVEPGLKRLRDGNHESLSAAGWDHFS